MSITNERGGALSHFKVFFELAPYIQCDIRLTLLVFPNPETCSQFLCNLSHNPQMNWENKSKDYEDKQGESSTTLQKRKQSLKSPLFPCHFTHQWHTEEFLCPSIHGRPPAWPVREELQEHQVTSTSSTAVPVLAQGNPAYFNNVCSYQPPHSSKSKQRISEGEKKKLLRITK